MHVPGLSESTATSSWMTVPGAKHVRLDRTALSSGTRIGPPGSR
jgi:hypothetical protein